MFGSIGADLSNPDFGSFICVLHPRYERSAVAEADHVHAAAGFAVVNLYGFWKRFAAIRRERHMEYLISQDYRDSHRAAIERQRVSGNSPIVGRTIELEGLRKDGSSFPIELSLASWTAAEGTFFTGIIRDITERKDAAKSGRTPFSGRRSA